MRYKSFRIRNFKGIKDTTINLSDSNGPSIFTLVGLNESGKTTILEAIHSFSPEEATSALVTGKRRNVISPNMQVPRHLISSFTGSVTITATVSLDESDKDYVCQYAQSNHKITLNKNQIGSEVVFESRHDFVNGDFKSSHFDLLGDFLIKTGTQRKWRPPNSQEERDNLEISFFVYTPDIAYFPTFVFDFPKEIYLTETRGGQVSQFYRRVLQDVLDFDKKGQSIRKNIVSRVRAPKLIVDWLTFLTEWNKNDENAKIQHILDRAGAVVTQVVFGRWNQIFGEDAKGKEVSIPFEVVEGQVMQKDYTTIKTQEHDIRVRFQVRDGTRRFDVNDRSLGFRWFFAFILFTQFRVARAGTRPLLFLFDEPASNLHAAAQTKLIESFPEIVKGDHTLIYTTHSHYLIEPKWLEQTSIVTNRSDSPSQAMIAELSLDDESLDIQAQPYRSFVNAYPSRTSYFQPIIDRLNVVPSKFDIQRSSIVVEGKSDYYILRYAIALHSWSEIPLMPGLGAGTFDALVAINLGWGLNALFVLDGDRKGKEEKSRYISDYGLKSDRVLTINEIVSDLGNCSPPCMTVTG